MPPAQSRSSRGRRASAAARTCTAGWRRRPAGSRPSSAALPATPPAATWTAGACRKRSASASAWATPPAARTGLKDHLVAKGAHPGELVEAGLLIAPEDGGGALRPLPRPPSSSRSPTGGDASCPSGGRALNPQAKAKYLNGPETALFHKGSTLYGLPRGPQAAARAGIERGRRPGGGRRLHGRHRLPARRDRRGRARWAPPSPRSRWRRCGG